MKKSYIKFLTINAEIKSIICRLYCRYIGLYISGRRLTMKISSLKYFVVIAETGSINQASQKLFVAQPSLTKSVKMMEDELGVTLFERKKSGMTLTSAGEKVYKEARIILDYYNGWKKLGSKDDSLTINIYTHISLVGFLIPKILIPFQKSHPGVHLKYQVDAAPEKQVTSVNTSPTVALCLNHEGDLEKDSSSNDRVSVTLMKGYYGCLVSKDSQLAQYKTVSFSDLKGYNLVYPSHASFNDDQVYEISAFSMLSDFLPDLVKEISINNVMNVDSVQTVIKMASEQPEAFAISFYPANLRYTEAKNGNVVCIPFEEDATKGDLSLAYSEKIAKEIPVYKELTELIISTANSFMTVHHVD